MRASADLEWTDDVFVTGVRKAIGTVTGTDTSKSIERMLGINNRQRGVCPAKCPPGEPGIFLKFDPNSPVEDSDNSDDPDNDTSCERHSDAKEK